MRSSVACEISVCVATCRRPEGLARLLESLLQLEDPGVAWELVVVDNDPEGSATPVLARFGERLPLRALAEPRRNIAHARNRAVKAAAGAWLAFVDDDETAQPGWLAAYWSRAREGTADGWFGPVVPVLERNVTPWLSPRFYDRPRHATGSAIGVADVRTSNALVRAALFEARGFDASLGLRGGSDTELFGHLLRAGARFAWCDEAIVHEYIPPARHRLRWLSQRAFRGGFVHTLLELRRHGRGVTPRVAGRALGALLLFALALPL
ncbi:MAG: glycosyltransferase family 2 protein, partial [Myxococcota bacterium]